MKKTKLKYKIKEDIVKATDKCGHKFSCLSGNKECLCDVENIFNDSVIFVNPPRLNTCDYLMSFGYSYVCNCPIRKEIYNQYRI